MRHYLDKYPKSDTKMFAFQHARTKEAQKHHVAQMQKAMCAEYFFRCTEKFALNPTYSFFPKKDKDYLPTEWNDLDCVTKFTPSI